MKIEVKDLEKFLKAKENRIVSVFHGEVMKSYTYLSPGTADADIQNLVAFIGRTAKSPSDLLSQSKAAVLFLDQTVFCDPQKTNSTLIVTKNARLLFCEFLNFVLEKGRDIKGYIGISHIHETATIGQGTSIGNGCNIGENVRIGQNCTIHHNVTILHDVEIGNGVVIAPGVVIGYDGFGFEKDEDGSNVKFPHIGTVVIEDNVEIGANTVIDRGTLSATRICRGVKIDNLVHISHNAEIGGNSLVIANAMIGGGTKVGPDSWIGPSANLLDRIQVGAKSFVGMGVSVINNLGEGEKYTLRHFLRLFTGK